jgi:hypothetical protein
VEAPAPHVFGALTDWRRQSDWIMATTVRPVGRQSRAIGDRIEAFTGLRTPLGAIGFMDKMVVTEWVEGRSVTVAHIGRVVRGSGSFAVTPRTAQACDIAWTEDLTIPGGSAGRVLWRLLRPVSTWAVRQSLNRFAQQVESEPAQMEVPSP